MSVSVRLLFLAALAWVAFVLFAEIKEQSRLQAPDNGKVALLFCGTILDGLGIALIVASWVVPLIGEAVGSFFFDASGEIEPDPHSMAISKLAQGDPEGAIEEYEKIVAKDPADSHAIAEMAKICCKDLEDSARAAAILSKALEGDWPSEQMSFLANRLADVYLLQDDPMRARDIVMQIAESLPDTRFSANAQHRLNEINRSIESGTVLKPTL